MTITTGAALAPDDDASADVEPDGSAEASTSDESGITLTVAPDLGNGISLAIAPDVETPEDPPAAQPAAESTPRPVGPPLPFRQAAGIPSRQPDSPLLTVTALSTAETPPEQARASLADRVRGSLPFTGPGLTGLGGVVLATVVVGVGAVGDLALNDRLGLGFTATFLLGCVLVAATLRTRALAVAMVLPPLLFAGSYALETKSSGQTSGRRQMALDVATSLALHAPVLFVGTALAVAVVLVRVVVHLFRR